MVTSPTWKDANDWGVRKELTAFLTTDEGKTWSGGLLLDERNNVSYPDIAQAPNGDIYVHYDTVRPHSALGYRPPAPKAMQPCVVATAAPPQPHRAGLLEGKTLT
jgi:hypothetical protein